MTAMTSYDIAKLITLPITSLITLPMNDIINDITNDIIGRIMSGKESSLAGNVLEVSHKFFPLL